MEKKHYECMFIISADTPETKREELIKQFSKMAGSDSTVEKLGMRKFAMPINYKTQGFYVILNFTAEPAVPAKMTNLMNITDGIVRHLFIVKDDEMLAQDVIRRQNRLRAIANRAERQADEEKTDERSENRRVTTDERSENRRAATDERAESKRPAADEKPQKNKEKKGE
jgi:small subunit ribosomal protein S6